MRKFSSKSGGVPFQISFFLGDLTRNDPHAKILAELLGHQKFDGKVIFSTNFYGIHAGLLRLSQ